MSYIGKTPAAAALTSSDISDGIIITDKLANNAVVTSKITDATVVAGDMADNAISLAKMASGTDGNIISYDASGNPVAVATGSDGQVLTSTGAGSPPVFEALPAGASTTLTTQGDLLYRDGSGLQRLAKGTANQTLQMNSGANAPNWTTVAAASAVAGTKAFMAYGNADSSALNNSADTEIIFNAERYDTESVYNTSNGRYTPGVVGLYNVFTNIAVNNIDGANDQLFIAFRVNGSGGIQYGSSFAKGDGSGARFFVSSAAIKLTSTSDYISIFVWQNAGTSIKLQDSSYSFFGYRLT